MPGVKTPEGMLDGPLQVPPVCGVPPNWPKRFTGGAFEQRVTVASVPALGRCVTLTVTTAVALRQGVRP